MSKIYHFGIVGCGAAATTHARLLAELPGACFVGVTDKKTDAAERFAEEYGVSYCTVPAKTSDLPTFLYWFAREIIMVWYYSIF